MADARAGAYAKRIAGLFERSAAALTVTRAGVDHTAHGFFQPLDPTASNLYFDGNESVGLLRPGLMVWLNIAADVQVDDVFVHDAGNRPGGDLYTVRKRQFFREGDTPLLMLALCD